MSKIKELVMYERRDKDDYSILTAKIEDDGDLMLGGYDVGKFPESFWGDSDYEYWLLARFC